MRSILLTNGCHVKQSISTHCRIPPPSKITIPLNEQLFHTVFPDTPLTFSAFFTRSGDSTRGKPLAIENAEFPSDGLAKRGFRGGDGLEPGQDYVWRVAGEARVFWDVVPWWEYGTKEQVSGKEGDEGGLDGTRVNCGTGPHDAIRLIVQALGPLCFGVRSR